MKKNWVVILAILCVNVSFAQTKIGLKFSPSFINNRVDGSTEPLVERDGLGFRPSMSIFFDLPLSLNSENYYFSTGIGYTSRLVKITVDDALNSITTDKKYNLQYILLPATLKLYTNEIALDKRVYFLIGPQFEIKIHENENNPTYQVVNKYDPLDIAIIIEAGVDYNIGINTSLFAGIHYHRGMINTVSNKNSAYFGDLSIKNDLIGFDVGIKF